MQTSAYREEVRRIHVTECETSTDVVASKSSGMSVRELEPSKA